MSTRLPLIKIEAILHDHLQPYRCECQPQSDSSMSVRLYGDQADREELTVLGIRYDQCRDAATWCAWPRSCASNSTPRAASCRPNPRRSTERQRRSDAPRGPERRRNLANRSCP